ncbi:MAG: biotin/lipoyl-containing protein [Candidatus Binataceae bacterium]
MSSRYIATVEGRQHEVEMEELAGNRIRATLGGHAFEADIERVGDSSFSVLVDHRSFDLDVMHEGEEMVVSVRGALTHVTLVDSARSRKPAGSRPQAQGRAELKAMMPGRVINVLVNPGDEVAFQQGVVVVEAMKMENELKASKAGKVAEVKVTAGQTVEKGDILLIIE